jgi:pre-mRNA-splicing factor SPF27
MLASSGTSCPLLIQNQALIDSLPYIDKEYENVSSQQMVQHLIQEEMKTFQMDEAKYLAFLPAYQPLFSNHLCLQKEFKRVSANVPLDVIDLNRYIPKEPTSSKKKQDIEEWKKQIRLFQIHLEYQNNHLCNLELQSKYGIQMLKIKAKVLDELTTIHQQAIDQIKKESEQINLKRKQEQILNQTLLKSHQEKFFQLVQKNQQIQVKNHHLLIYYALLYTLIDLFHTYYIGCM